MVLDKHLTPSTFPHVSPRTGRPVRRTAPQFLEPCMLAWSSLMRYGRPPYFGQHNKQTHLFETDCASPCAWKAPYRVSWNLIIPPLSQEGSMCSYNIF